MCPRVISVGRCASRIGNPLTSLVVQGVCHTDVMTGIGAGTAHAPALFACPDSALVKGEWPPVPVFMASLFLGAPPHLVFKRRFGHLGKVGC